MGKDHQTTNQSVDPTVWRPQPADQPPGTETPGNSRPTGAKRARPATAYSLRVRPSPSPPAPCDAPAPPAGGVGGGRCSVWQTPSGQAPAPIDRTPQLLPSAFPPLTFCALGALLTSGRGRPAPFAVRPASPFHAPPPLARSTSRLVLPAFRAPPHAVPWTSGLGLLPPTWLFLALAQLSTAASTWRRPPTTFQHERAPALAPLPFLTVPRTARPRALPLFSVCCASGVTLARRRGRLQPPCCLLPPLLVPCLASPAHRALPPLTVFCVPGALLAVGVGARCPSAGRPASFPPPTPPLPSLSPPCPPIALTQ